MKNSLIKFLSYSSLILVFTFSSCSDDDGPTSTGSTSNETLLDIASADSELSLFVEAIKKTNLDGNFTSSGTFTAFMPTNAVFTAYLTDLGYTDIDAWLTVADADVVRQMLLYHLMSSEFTMTELVTGYLKTVATNDNNFQLDIFINSTNGVKINGLNTSVISGDIEASNGRIHKLDGVLQPQNIAEILANNPDFADLITAANLAGGMVINTLSTPNTSYTMLAPNNGAFNQFYSQRTDINNVNEMASVLGTSALQDILDYHVLLGSLRSANFATQSYDTRLGGAKVSINTSGGNLSLSDEQGRQAFFLFKDVAATNGNLHIISNVLLNL